ncbi:FIG00732589: hypothetical protein [Klebsiella pneumoniae IS43]|uniref:GGDEF domain-containing protein n=1 Tax=Klebsiella pneumoniae IS43 TaxID=1432552 RepID=W1DQ90_KLEPN|nr:FIG00732589: hypothetical protein [Klebsiella pneumoniae IS43]
MRYCVFHGLSRPFCWWYITKNFLQGVQSEYSLSFVLSVLISFTICLFYMADIYARSDRNKRRWRSQAEEDPLTGLPNLRALESHLQSCPQQAICSLRIDNLDFLSRHYGLMMGVDCKRQIIRALQPLLGAADKVFQVPGSELILVLDGPEPSSRLNHMVAVLNHKKVQLAQSAAGFGVWRGLGPR